MATYEPVGFRNEIDDLYTVGNVEDLLEDHKADPVIRLETRPNTLVIHCLRVLAKTFSTDEDLAPSLLKVIPHFNMNLFLWIIPIDAPLTITVPHIKSDVYWKRCCLDRWPKQVYRLKEKSYKQVFAERYLAEYLHTVTPGYEDFDQIRELCVLLHRHVYRLKLTGLNAGQPRRTEMDGCVQVEDVPSRLDLRRVVAFLPKLTEIQICFGMRNPMPSSSIRQAVLTEAEIDLFGQAIILSKTLTIIRITVSNFKGNDLAILYHYLIESNVMSLEIEGCFIGDSGAQIASLIIKNHPILLKLSLKDNDIGPQGGYALAYALSKEPRSSLRCLILDLNPLGDDAGACLASSVTRHSSLEELRMSGTELSTGAGSIFAKALELNRTLRNVDLSCNDFSRENAVAFLKSFEVNRTLEFFDVRSCGFHHETMQDFKDICFENREAKRTKKVSKRPKPVNRILHVSSYLETLPRRLRKEPIIYDPVPAYNSHCTSSLSLSDHGQITLSSVDSTSSESTQPDEVLCDEDDK